MAEHKSPTKDAGKKSADNAEFDRFQALTQKLVRVPKHEIDAERAKQNGAAAKPDR